MGGEPGFWEKIVDFEVGFIGGFDVDSEFVLSPAVSFEFYAVGSVS